MINDPAYLEIVDLMKKLPPDRRERLLFELKIEVAMVMANSPISQNRNPELWDSIKHLVLVESVLGSPKRIAQPFKRVPEGCQLDLVEAMAMEAMRQAA